MMTSFKIATLYIEGFRGLSEPLMLDLRSPITLLYAANGTGKTSVCDAAEWLLTGQVDRLRKSQHFDPAILLPKFPITKDTPLVSADINQDRLFNLSRTTDGATIVEDGSTSPIILNQILERLAPQASNPELHHVTAIHQRQNWLRGTHFLSMEALAALIDTDESTVERRKQIFADLLGIRHLLDASREIEKYREVIDSREHEVSREIGESNNKIDALSRLLDRTNAHDQTLVGAIHQVEVALFGKSAIKSRINLEEAGQRIEKIAAEHARLSEAHRQRENTLATLEAVWPELSGLNSTLKRETANEERIKKQHIEIFEGIKQLADQRNFFERQLIQNDEEQKDIMSALDGVSGSAEKLSKAAVVNDGWAKFTVRDISEIIPKQMLSGHVRAEQARVIFSIRSQTKQVSRERDRLIEMTNELKSARDGEPVVDQLAGYKRELPKLQIKANDARRRLEGIKDPIERLRSAGSELLAHPEHDDDSTCPLCGHDWVTTRRLQSAVKEILSASPTIVQNLTRAATAASKELEALKQLIERAIARRKQIETLEMQIANSKQLISEYDKHVKSLGLNANIRNFNYALQQHSHLLFLAEALGRVDKFDPVTS
jgi:exonuclease SbcC